jgi:predicted anti-sigma-YlaC factor YlaD
VQAIKKIDIKLAAGIVMALLSVIVVFHLLVLSGVIPYNIVWGGRLESAAQMYVLETVSLAVILAVILVVAIKGGYIKPFLPPKVVTILLWLLTALFALNTVGNLFAESTVETMLFTPITLISAVLLFRMAIER